MIERYSRPEMKNIWSCEHRYRIWFEVEAYVCEALASIGKIPKEAAKNIWEKGSKAQFNAARIAEIENETKHDVIAFLTHLGEFIGDDARYIHQGLTSSDLLDTSLNLQLMQSSDLLLKNLENLLDVLKKVAIEHKYSLTIGRSHGIHAEPTTFGLKIAVAYSEFLRCKHRLIEAKKEISICAISGAVGTFANIDPYVENYVSQKLNMQVELISTQVVPRDRHAVFFSTLAIIASSVERLAIEIRHLQRTEVLEVEEMFTKGQKGSSAMPHKRNPVLSENLTGLARIIRSYALPAMENIALWHERDISHSSVERFIAPDACITLDFALARLTQLMDNLVIYPKNMEKNLNKLNGLIHSQRVLLALIEKGVSREAAYKIVQRNAMKVWEQNKDFKTELQNDKDVNAILLNDEIDLLFDNSYHIKYVDTIFKRVFGQDLKYEAK